MNSGVSSDSYFRRISLFVKKSCPRIMAACLRDSEVDPVSVNLRGIAAVSSRVFFVCNSRTESFVDCASAWEIANSETANLLRQAVDNFISKIPIDRNAKGKNGVTILLQLNIEHVAILPPRSEASNVSVNEVKLKDST